MTRGWSSRGLAALVLLAACHSSDHPLIVSRGSAVRGGVVTGFVVDDETGDPVRAQVLVDGIPVRAAADGSFTASALAGRARVEVRAEGYLKTFRDVAVGSQSLPMPFKVARRAPRKVLGGEGGRVLYRGAVLEFAAGTFHGAEVALTYLNRARVAAIVASPQFVDDAGVPRRALALVDLDAAAPPDLPVRVQVPVTDDASADTITGFAVDGSGQWSGRLPPESVENGMATFSVAGTIQFGVVVDVRSADGSRPGYVITESGDLGAKQGDVLSGDDFLAVGARAAALVDPHGSRVELAPATRARVAVPGISAGNGGASRVARYAGQVAVTAGRARVVVPPARRESREVTFTARGRAASYQVKGTAFTLATCLNGVDAVDVLEVVEGTVEASHDGKTEAVSEGESATICASCKTMPAPMCQSESPPERDAGLAPIVDAAIVETDGAAATSSLEASVPAHAPEPPDAGLVDAAPAPDLGTPDVPVDAPPDAAPIADAPPVDVAPDVPLPVDVTRPRDVGVDAPPDGPLDPDEPDRFEQRVLILPGGGLAAAGVGLAGRGAQPKRTAAIELTSIPAGSTIVSAHLYYVTIGGPHPTITLAGRPLRPALIGQAADTCWKLPAGNFVYRANVRSLVTGNGSYGLGGFPSSIEDPVDGQGAALVVLYQDAGDPRRNLIALGETLSTAKSGGSIRKTLNGFTVPAHFDAAWSLNLVGDGQPSGDRLAFNGKELEATGVFQGADGQFWDTQRADVAAFLKAGDTAFETSISVPPLEDCLVWVLNALVIEGYAAN